MDTVDLARAQLELNSSLNDAVDIFRHTLDKDVETNMSDAHDTMITFLATSALSARFKKEYDKSKKDLDACAEVFDIPTIGVAGQTVDIYTVGGLNYSKRQNKDGITTLLTDFVNALSRCDVDKETIDKALKMAEKPKKGNTYYLVTVVE